MQVQDKLGPGDKSTSCMSIASASKMRMHIKEEAAHVIGLVLLPREDHFVCKMGDRR